MIENLIGSVRRGRCFWLVSLLALAMHGTVMARAVHHHHAQKQVVKKHVGKVKHNKWAKRRRAASPVTSVKPINNPTVSQIPPVDEATALTSAALEIARQIDVGSVPCELGAVVTLNGDAQSPGYFDVHFKNNSYRMSPVDTSTGALRLEDPKAGVVWLQLPHKSMLMDQKIGRRLADSCMSSAQHAAADASAKVPMSGLALMLNSSVTTK